MNKPANEPLIANQEIGHLDLIYGVFMSSQKNLCALSLQVTDLSKKVQLVPYSITSVGHGADSVFLAVSPLVTLVINPVVGCHYFPPGLRLLSQPKRSSPWPVPNYTGWRQRHAGVLSNLLKTTMQWCPAKT